MLGRGALGWVYEYQNRETIRRTGAVATGLEIGVQLRGEWHHEGARTGRGVYGPGSVHVISPGERYGLGFHASPFETGLQVGFIVYPDELPELFSVSSPAGLAFAEVPSLDRHMWDLCLAYQSANDRGAPLPPAQVGAEVARWVRSRVREVEPDPLELARHELERNFRRALYLRHLAEVAGMSPVMFSRRFARRFGATPVAYRVQLRVNAAARLLWSRPDLTVREVADAVGFEDESYFHRAFVREMGKTPAQYGRRSAHRGAARETKVEAGA